MPELIERDALKNYLYRAQAEAFKHSEWYVAGAIQSFIELLDKQPTIEPEGRRSRWITRDSKSAKCSCCGWLQRARTYYLPDDIHEYSNCYRFCTSCGERMDGGGENG